MSYIYYNPNPKHKMTTDCVIRMLTKIFDRSWSGAYIALSTVVLTEYEMPSDNDIWEIYLEQNGFRKYLLSRRMTIREFCNENPIGTYVLCTGSHVVAAINGNYYDAWDSGSETMSYFFVRR